MDATVFVHAPAIVDNQAGHILYRRPLVGFDVEKPLRKVIIKVPHVLSVSATEDWKYIIHVYHSLINTFIITCRDWCGT